jgi:limonene-1,2-epoxide hydrolase
LKRGFNKDDTKELVQQLIASRNAGARTEAERLLSPHVRYWDCLRGDVNGPEGAATALLEPSESQSATRFDVEMLAAGEGRAVAELRVSGRIAAGPLVFTCTEVYTIDDDGIASCRAYLDPAELPGRRRAARK